ncbi:MAG: phosphoadenylyl-sulfate reductase [Spirochaetia bacterium]
MEAIKKIDITALNEESLNSGMKSIISLAYRTWGGDLGMTTAFGYSGLVILHHLYKMNIPIDIYFIDTGFHFPQTLNFAKELQERWDLNLNIIRPQQELQDYVSIAMGSEPYKNNANLCCHYFKVGPLLRILPEKAAWISGLRRDQTKSREHIKNFEIDPRGTLKVHPLAYYTRKDLWKYITENNLPYHPLHDKGYASIGCAPCTSQIFNDNNEREGRWKDSSKLECGLHIF